MNTTMAGSLHQPARSNRIQAADHAERGSVTAEYAVLLPVIVLCLALILGASSVGIERIRAEEAARVAARMIARGDDQDQAAAAAQKVFGGSISISTDTAAEFVQVSVRADSMVPLLGWVLPAHQVQAYTVAEHHD